MSCYNPLRGLVLGKNGNGKADIRVVPKKSSMTAEKEIKLPCGNCFGCRLDTSRSWAVRCVLEAKNYKDNYFVTLTYSPEHLPLGWVNDPDTGEVFQQGILRPDHLTSFMKSLRKYYEYHFKHIGIRFFAAGEYGDRGGRPHFHLILFNLPINDLKFHKFNYRGDRFDTSDLISSIWGKGFVEISAVNFETAAYTARYVMKKRKGKDKSYYETTGLVPEFTRMSRNPGIGRDYFEKNKLSIYENDFINVRVGKEFQQVRPSRYYDRLYASWDPYHFADIKDDREKFAISKEKRILEETGVPAETYLKNIATEKAKKVLKLKRKGL